MAMALRQRIQSRFARLLPQPPAPPTAYAQPPAAQRPAAQPPFKVERSEPVATEQAYPYRPVAGVVNVSFPSLPQGTSSRNDWQ